MAAVLVFFLVLSLAPLVPGGWLLELEEGRSRREACGRLVGHAEGQAG